ncbi:hypothetical protein [Acinetobacter sp. P8-3-8]|nr:hypothetical protein [Acinetobacter sp. P8-3-8]
MAKIVIFNFIKTLKNGNFISTFYRSPAQKAKGMISLIPNNT